MSEVKVNATLADGSDWSKTFEVGYSGASFHGMRSIEERATELVERELGPSVRFWHWQFLPTSPQEDEN